MRRLFLAAIVIAAGALVVVELGHARRVAPAGTAPIVTTEVPPPGTTPQAHVRGSKTWAPPPWVRSEPQLTRGFVPRGFRPDFREMIVSQFQDTINARLGQDFPVAKRIRIAEAQNAFWDENGPLVDAFQSGRMSQPEFAERTHMAMAHYADHLEKILSDDEYQKLLDSPKGVDPYYLLFHSPGEQPGMPMQEAANEPLVRYRSDPAPVEPPPTGGRAPAPPPGSVKSFSKPPPVSAPPPVAATPKGT
jgi:hypothetical protein